MTTPKIILISTVIVLILFIAFVYESCFANYYKETLLTSDFLITNEWKEIESLGRIKIKKDTQFIELLLQPPDSAWKSNTFTITSAGQNVNVEMKLIDSEGTEYELKANAGRGYHDKEFIEFGYKDRLPADKTYIKLMLRSDRPIKMKEILWAGYNIRDRP